MAATAKPLVAAPADQAPRRTPRSRAARRRTALLLAPATAWVLVAVLVPIAMIVWVSFWRVEGGELVPAFDVSTWENVVSDPGLRRVALQTIKVAAIVLAVVTSVGLVAGYFLARFVASRRLQTVLLLLAILPFWTSYVIRVITWQPLFGSQGVINYVLGQLGIVDEPISAFLYNETAQMFVMGTMYVVFVIGPVYWALSRIDPEVVAAARSLGASPWRTFWTVELPLARGGLVAGAFFATIFIFGDSATERLIGGGTSPALAGTITAIAGSGQWPTAAALAVVLLAIALATLAVLMRVHDLRREL
jgi:putative spermidine/putrescine transport system permease protein